MSRKKNINIILFTILILAFVLDQLCIGFQLANKYRYATKTILIPILTKYYWINATKPNITFLFGLVLSFFGDLFLLLKGGFILGLSSFLIAHILYILTFKPLFQKKNSAIIVFILIFILGLISFLYPYLGAMKIPVISYAITIGIMLYIAIRTHEKWLIVGALLFVISDSILAINIFYERSTLSNMMVMSTYMLAQFFLTKGILRTRK